MKPEVWEAVCQNRTRFPMAEVEDVLLEALEGEVYGPSVVEELLATTVDAIERQIKDNGEIEEGLRRQLAQVEARRRLGKTRQVIQRVRERAVPATESFRAFLSDVTALAVLHSDGRLVVDLKADGRTIGAPAFAQAWYPLQDLNLGPTD